MITGIYAWQDKKGEKYSLKKRNGKCTKKRDITTSSDGIIDIKPNKKLKNE